MSDNANAEKTLWTHRFVSVESAVICFGTVFIVLGFFFPWLNTSGFSISGYRLAMKGYPFLLLLPMAGVFSAVCTTSNPKYRPMPVMFAGIVGLAMIMTLVAIVLNNDTGALVFHFKANGGSRLEFIDAGQVSAFTGFGSVSIGLYMSLIGSMGIYLAPFFRSKAKMPRQKFKEKTCAMQKRIDSLEDLRPAWTLKKEISTTVAYFISGIVLIFTYTWCDISPGSIWENRGNAKEYLFGTELRQADRDYIEDQMKRAPEIEAQGLARAFQDNKYRNVPIEKQPSLQEKFKENEQLFEKFLQEMSEEEKQRLRERAYQNALDEKRGGYFPPETSWARIRGYLVALLETVAIAIWGTLLAIVCAVPASLLAAGNTLQLMISGEGFRGKALRWFSIFVVRRFLDACRGFNEFVMALIFVAVIGLGPFAGILALWIHTFGILGKVFSEQIEAIEGGQIEALKSTGAGVGQTIAFSVLPQVMPGFVSYSLLRFESNVRSATILGFVGAGGIGFLMFDKLNGYLFKEVCTMMIIIIIAVGVIDFLCGKLRRRFI